MKTLKFEELFYRNKQGLWASRWEYGDVLRHNFCSLDREVVQLKLNRRNDYKNLTLVDVYHLENFIHYLDCSDEFCYANAETLGMIFNQIPGAKLTLFIDCNPTLFGGGALPIDFMSRRPERPRTVFERLRFAIPELGGKS